MKGTQQTQNNEKYTEYPFKVKNYFEIYDRQNKIVENKKLSLKLIQSHINCRVKPNCEYKWDVYFEKELHWKTVWSNLNKNFAKRKAKQISWKILHQIVYTENKLKKIGYSSNGKCHFCKTEYETLEHLFVNCPVVKQMWDQVNNAFQMYNALNGLQHADINEETIIIGMCENPNTYLFNTVISTVKWVLWKSRNIIKFQQKTITSRHLLQVLKQELTFLTTVPQSSLSFFDVCRELKKVTGFINY